MDTFIILSKLTLTKSILSFRFCLLCRYDSPELIPDGSIQRAGENILALVKEIASSVYLEDPGDEKHGKVTYFDILGLTVVVYPERIGIILNWSTILLTIFGFWIGGKRKRGEGWSSYLVFH